MTPPPQELSPKGQGTEWPIPGRWQRCRWQRGAAGPCFTALPPPRAAASPAHPRAHSLSPSPCPTAPWPRALTCTHGCHSLAAAAGARPPPGPPLGTRGCPRRARAAMGGSPALRGASHPASRPPPVPRSMGGDTPQAPPRPPRGSHPVRGRRASVAVAAPAVRAAETFLDRQGRCWSTEAPPARHRRGDRADAECTPLPPPPPKKK